MRYHQKSSDYLDKYRKNKNCFGGALLRGNPKGKRPFSSRQALHIVLRSSLAKGKKSLLAPGRKYEIQALVRKQAKRFGVQLYTFANSGNHLHILARPARERADFVGFLRAISGLIARKVLRSEKGSPANQKFWDHRPFTRIVAWGQDFARCSKYIEKNIFEALGLDAVISAWEDFGRVARPA